MLVRLKWFVLERILIKLSRGGILLGLHSAYSSYGEAEKDSELVQLVSRSIQSRSEVIGVATGSQYEY